VSSRIYHPYLIILCAAPYGTIFMHTSALASLFILVFGLLTRLGGYRVEVSISVFYALAILLCMLPHVPGQESRTALFRLIRLMFSPGNSITFPEVVIADAFTSVSKVLKDFGISAFVVYCYFSGNSMISMHNEAMITVAALASLPYM
jgi:hypothetical protein